MSSPLIDRLVKELDYAQLDTDNFDTFVRAHEHSVLFCSSDPKSFPESNDVAVILPELIAAFSQRLVPAVVARSFENTLQRRYGFKAWPALVFLRRSDYLGAICRVQNWSDYCDQINTLLAAQTRRPPSVGIPVVTNSAVGKTCSL